MSIPGPPDVRLFLTDYLKRKLAGYKSSFYCRPDGRL